MSARERLTVVGGAAVVGFAVFYLYLWEPMIKESATLRERLPAQRQEAEWMRKNAPEAKRLRTAVESARKNAVDAEAFVKKTLEGSEAMDVTVEKMENDGVNLSIGSIEPKILFAVITKLRREGLMTAETLRMEALPDGKNVSAKGMFTPAVKEEKQAKLPV